MVRLGVPGTCRTWVHRRWMSGARRHILCLNAYRGLLCGYLVLDQVSGWASGQLKSLLGIRTWLGIQREALWGVTHVLSAMSWSWVGVSLRRVGWEQVGRRCVRVRREVVCGVRGVGGLALVNLVWLALSLGLNGFGLEIGLGVDPGELNCEVVRGFVAVRAVGWALSLGEQLSWGRVARTDSGRGVGETRRAAGGPGWRRLPYC